MKILIRIISVALLPCSFLLSTAAMAQDPITKTPIPDQDLRDDPLLKAKRLPVPPPPDLTRVGVEGGELTLTLNEAIRRALESNNDIEVSRDNVRLAESTLRSFEGVYDPIITLAPQFSLVRTPRVNSAGETTTIPASVPIQQTSWSITPALTKQFSTGGGQYQFFFNSQRGTSNQGFARLSPFYSTEIGATFTQPLLRNRSIDQFRHDIRVQRKRLTQSDADFRLQVINVISQVQQAYWELVFARRNEQNQLSNVNLAREQLRVIEEQVSVGTSATLERAQALTQIASAETALLSATQAVTTAENVLKPLVLRNKSATEWSNRLKPTDEPSLAATPINLKDALTEAFTNRPELSVLRTQRDINKIDTQFFKNQTLSRVDLQATVFKYGLAGSLISNPTTTNPLPDNVIGGYGQALRNLTGLNTGTVLVGAAIQIPLHNKTAKANLATARIQGEQLIATTQSTEQAVESDVRNAVQAVDTAQRQLSTARAATKSAEIQLAGEMKRYQAGMSTTFLIFQFEDQLVTARTAELRAEANYNQALANLQRATSATLRANQVTIK
ncbi:MAG TPA: TolC family protein [Pyrinomonadaceae bacterium]|nr:TolC family protein [Pyrinomonadaceae bacterium]